MSVATQRFEPLTVSRAGRKLIVAFCSKGLSAQKELNGRRKEVTHFLGLPGAGCDSSQTSTSLFP